MPSSVINSDDGSVSGTTGLKTTGGDDGELAFESSGTEAMRIDSSGTLTTYYASVFNESSGDYDFRVESDTNTHALFVDASNDGVAIGKNTIPTGVTLSVNGVLQLDSISSAITGFPRLAIIYYSNNNLADDHSIIYIVNSSGYQYHTCKIDIVVTNGDSLESTASLWVDTRETTVTSSNLGGINSTNIVAVNGTTGTDGKFNICANAQNGSSYLGLRNRMGGTRRVFVQITPISTR